METKKRASVETHPKQYHIILFYDYSSPPFTASEAESEWLEQKKKCSGFVNICPIEHIPPALWATVALGLVSIKLALSMARVTGL